LGWGETWARAGVASANAVAMARDNLIARVASLLKREVGKGVTSSEILCGAYAQAFDLSALAFAEGRKPRWTRSANLENGDSQRM
jgi:hypothetical protein